jgi:hypothetical protein
MPAYGNIELMTKAKTETADPTFVDFAKPTEAKVRPEIMYINLQSARAEEFRRIKEKMAKRYKRNLTNPMILLTAMKAWDDAGSKPKLHWPHDEKRGH